VTEASRQKNPFKKGNNSVRRSASAQAPKAVAPYRLSPQSLRARPGVDPDRALQLADQLEDGEVLRNRSPQE